MASPEPVRAHQHALRRVAEEALTRFPACATAAITVVEGDDPFLLVGTSLLGHQLDEAQWELGQGPGIDAIRQLQVFNVACLLSTTSWPEFSRLATSRGVKSNLAVPITWQGRAVGALSLYSLEHDGFAGQEQEALGSATAAALALSTPMRAALPEGGPEPARTKGDDREQAVS